MHFIARFHVRAGAEAAAEAAIAEVSAPTRAEAGCLQYRALRALADPRAFVIVSRWRDEAAFNVHADFPTPGAIWRPWAVSSIAKPSSCAPRRSPNRRLPAPPPRPPAAHRPAAGLAWRTRRSTA